MAPSEIVHATSVAVDGFGILILGASGSGKSALALDLIAHGAVLVADDRTILTRQGERLNMSVPDPIAGQIEARGIGILAADHTTADLRLAVTLDLSEPDRLPDRAARQITFLGLGVDLIRGKGTDRLAPALMLYARKGRRA